MDDSISIKSSDSTTTSDEYEFIPLTTNLTKVPLNNKNEQPLLKIAGNGDLDHLQKCLGEMLNEESNPNNKAEVNHPDSLNEKEVSNKLIQESEEQLEPLADVYQECTLFGCISYLGSAAVNAPRSKTEILRNMTILNEQSSEQAIKVSLSIPHFANGVVVLYDANNNSAMARYDVQRIMFYHNGTPQSNENSCFAFTYCHGDTQETALFQCHVFRCNIPEAVGPVSLCFGKAFQNPSNIMTNSKINSEQIDTINKSEHNVILEVGLDMKEDDGKGNFASVSRDGNSFKLRKNIEKHICISVQQILSKNQQEFDINCRGVLVSPGWNVKNTEMRLLDMISVGTRNEDDENQKTFVIIGKWEPKDMILENTNTTESTKMRLTVAVDLVIKQIKEYVRLSIETQCKLSLQNGRFWYFNKGPLFHQFNLCLKEISRNGTPETGYEVINIEKSAILNNTWSNFTNLIKSSSTTSLEGTSPTDEFSDTDEPMLSGTGEVSRECPARELGQWKEILDKWTNCNVRPKQLPKLVRQGIPEALRGVIWQRLTNSEKNEDLLNNYRILISKECNAELVIKKDIHRTFPAHDYFKEAGGIGQDTLFNISKAYAVYDTEIGYCQGLTFIAASLLLHMPEEEAFCVLIRLMYHYGLRNLYKDGFENLKMKLYQLNRLLEEKDPQLWQHFRDTGVETHMFAHHWFLTLYTARFPLYFVFFILDVVLAQGIDTIFQIALSLLITFKDELLTLDFENIVKYIQVTLPKKCRNHKTARKIITRACDIKLKKLDKYEREFLDMKTASINDEQYNNDLKRLQKILEKLEEEKRQVILELSQTKEALFLETQKSELENKRNSSIIADYKQICQRLDKEQATTKLLLNTLQTKVSNCEHCSSVINEVSIVKNDDYYCTAINNNKEDVSLTTKIKELELELAQTKLALVEAECRNQDLTHQLSSVSTELHGVRNQYPPWLHKTLSSIKEVTANKRTVNNQNVANKLFSLTKTESILN